MITRIAYIIYFALLPTALLSQEYTLMGKVVDQDRKPLENMNVQLLKQDSTLLKQVVTDSNGAFSMKENNGNYMLKISRLGQEFLLRDIKLSTDFDLGELIINTTLRLEDVVVNGERKLIERKVDRLVFNVENSPAMQGVDVSEALANTPMLNTSDEGVTIVGKSGFDVMINERLINLSGNELMQYLKSLRSDDVSRIEVITSPPAKYDAQGNSGLINIILKKKKNNGFQATLSSTYLQRTYGGIGNNANVNFQSEKLLLSVGLRHYDVAFRSTENASLIGNPTSTVQSDKRKDFNDGGGLNINLDYKINESSNIGVIYDGSIGHVNMDIASSTQYLTNNIQDSTLWTNSKHRQSLNFQTVSGYYDLKLDTLGRKLSFIGNFLSNGPKNPVDFTSNNSESGNSYSVRNESDVSYQVLSGQADLNYPIKAINLDMGIKYSDISNSSSVKYLNLTDGDFIIDPLKSNDYDYSESNYAVYISGARKLSNKLEVKAGIRYEYTDVKGFSPETAETNTFNYGKFFPSGYISFTPNDKHTLSFSYSKRINRPSFGNLNPFRWYSNPYTYSTGNPNLLPSFNNNIELGYIFDGNLSITLYNQRVTDGYSYLSFLDNTIKMSTWENHLTQHNSGLNIGYSFNRVKWLQSYLFSDLSYSKSESSLEEVIPQKGFSYYYMINNSFFLNKEKTISFLLNYWQNLPRRAGNSFYRSAASLRTGVNLQLLDKKLQVQVMAEDIFKQNRTGIEAYFLGNTQYFNNYYDARRLTLGVTYRFGLSSMKTNNKDTRFDERGRAN